MGQRPARALQECHDGVLQSVSNDELNEGDNAVVLNVYDLNEQWLQTNDVLQETLEIGAFHAGVEVYGREWTFSPDGVCYSWPRCNEVHVFRTSIFIGYTKYSQDEVTCILEDE